MKISIIGTGYVGLVTGACFAEAGHNVTCIDIDKLKIAKLKKLDIPFYEENLPEVIESGIQKGLLNFTSSYKTGIKKDTEAIFLCVGTPPKKSGNPNLAFLKKALESIVHNYNGVTPLFIYIKSTVPVGTNKFAQNYLIKHSNNKQKFIVASNPEFLQEGSSVSNFREPDRIIVGTDNDELKNFSKQLYKPFSKNGKILKFTNIESAELIKYASNTFLATKISFMNELSRLSNKVGGNIEDIKMGMGLDPRIGNKFLNAGLGFGGSCLPKDLKGLMHSYDKFKIKSDLPAAVEKINEEQVEYFFQLIKSKITIENSKFLFWGISFKPNTDDIRDSQSIKLVKKLLNDGAIVHVYDPKGLENFKKEINNNCNIEILNTMYDNVEDCDALIIGTEWQEFKKPDFGLLAKLKSKKIFDGRNCMEINGDTETKFKYYRISS